MEVELFTMYKLHLLNKSNSIVYKVSETSYIWFLSCMQISITYYSRPHLRSCSVIFHRLMSSLFSLSRFGVCLLSLHCPSDFPYAQGDKESIWSCVKTLNQLKYRSIYILVYIQWPLYQKWLWIFQYTQGLILVMSVSRHSPLLARPVRGLWSIISW